MKEIFDIQEYTEFLYKIAFNEKLKIPVKINNRLRTTIAWFVYDDNPRIEVSGMLLDQNNYIIADVILHELTHYYLWSKDLPFDDNDDQFKIVVNRIGACETQTLTADAVMQCYHVRYVARHKKCGFENSIFIKNNNLETDPPICFCPKCNKMIRYKKDEEYILDYMPNDQIKEYVSIWNKEN